MHPLLLVYPAVTAPHYRGGKFEDFSPGDGSLEAKADVAEELPGRIMISGGPQALPVAGVGNGSLIVSESARTLVEGADPGLRQFFPVRLETTRGVVVPGDRFILHIHTRQAPVIDELTDSKPMYTHDETRACMMLTGADPRITLRRSALGPANLWREERYTSAGYFISQSLLARFRAEGMSFLQRHTTVDLAA